MQRRAAEGSGGQPKGVAGVRLSTLLMATIYRPTARPPYRPHRIDSGAPDGLFYPARGL